MATILRQLDDIRQVQTPDKIASLFHKFGYNARSNKNAKGKDVEGWEAKINNRVAHLYELTVRKIKLIESMGCA